MKSDDRHTLSLFVKTRCEDAFRALVEAHLGMVFATARRQLNGDGALAEDVAQQVFIDLARKSASLPPGVVPAGWLYRHTLFLARKAVRSESRRRRREGIASEWARIEAECPGESEQWRRFSPIMDEALTKLRPGEREALVLRFLEGRPLRAVGASLGVTEDAARKRISRALEKVRAWLRGRGIPISTSALAAALVSESADAAVPARLSEGIAGTALNGVPAATAGILPVQMIRNLVAVAAGFAATFLASAALVNREHAADPWMRIRARTSRISALGMGQRTADSVLPEKSLPLDAILRRIRALAGKPSTARGRAEIAAWIGKIAPEELAGAATALSGSGNSRAVWLAAMPALFDRWTRFELDVAFDFCASTLSGNHERLPWNELLRGWSPSPERAEAAMAWFVSVAAGETAHPLGGPSGLMTDTGAEIALKAPWDFESFLASIPEIPASGAEEYLLADTIRGTALSRVPKLPLEEQRRWAEALVDPDESARVISSMLNGALETGETSESGNPSAALWELGDWAWESLPGAVRDQSIGKVLGQLSRHNVDGAIAWYRAKAGDEVLGTVAISVLPAVRYDEPRIQLAWADVISDPGLREDVAAGVFRRWCRRAPGERNFASTQLPVRETATEYLAKADISPLRRARFEAIAAMPWE